MAAVALVAALLTACGGGGGGGGSSTSTEPSPTPVPTPTPSPPPPEALFTLAGTVTASASQAADSDNNDPARVAISNDTPESAQPIPNPITLGGYINQPGFGTEGRSRASGDIDDFFRVELLAGQRITMIVADFQQADADLYLWDEFGNAIVDFSVDTGEIESLVVPENGTYLVNAFAFSGATNYTLAIGTTGTTALPASERYRDILPWQSVVRYRENGPVTEQDTAPAILERLALVHRAGGRGRSRLLALRQIVSEAVERRRRLGAAAGKAAGIGDDHLRARWETLLTIKQLRRDPALLYAEPNYRLRSLATPDDRLYPIQWHYPLINLPAAWDTTSGDAAVVVAVVDTGILGNHPDFAGQLVAGYDFVSDPRNAADGDGIDPDPEDPGSSIGSSVFHGTHVSGTVAARGDNGLGVVGTAYTSRLMPLRALGADGSGTSYDVDQAVRYAAGLENDSGSLPATRADIINLSLGGPAASAASRDLFREVTDAGVMVVAAAGNEASAAPLYPAGYEPVIAVSAVDLQRRLTPYSNTGAHIDIAAPGGNNSQDLNGDGYPDGVLSTGGDLAATGISFEYSFLSGTSMAAPHVAGVLALMKSINPGLTPGDIDALISLGELTDDLGPPGRDDQYGYGLVNAQKAVLAALEAGGTSPADNPRLVASTATLNFASGTSALDLALENGGKGALSLEEIAVSSPWLSIAPGEVDAAGLGIYRVGVERETLDPGVYEGAITAVSSVNSVTVRVLVTVGGEGAVADVGVVYVLLVDDETGEPVGQSSSGPIEGRYAYRFDGVASGYYRILAGSDADNDLLICDAGEACGALLTVDQPIVIEVDGDQEALDFPIEYQVAIPDISSGTGETGAPVSERVLPKGKDNRIIGRRP
jgi:serine protease